MRRIILVTAADIISTGVSFHSSCPKYQPVPKQIPQANQTDTKEVRRKEGERERVKARIRLCWISNPTLCHPSRPSIKFLLLWVSILSSVP